MDTSSVHVLSLEEIHSSVAIPRSWWRRFLAFSGPALLAGVAALAVLDFERGAPHSRAIALGCLVLGAVLLIVLGVLVVRIEVVRLPHVLGQTFSTAARGSAPSAAR